MDRASVPKPEWTLTGEAFAKFLACLDPDPDCAGEKYENLRLTLIKFFDWRGAHFPEECADETINRVVRKLDGGDVLRDVETYCLGVARMVFLETLKRPEHRRVGLDEAPDIAAPVSSGSEDEEEDEQRRCFNHCLRELPPESRQLILLYYQDERREKINNRQAMADRLGIPLNALRSRVQRIRDRLERCAEQCRHKIAPGGKKFSV
ncbi:MAG: sigma-70 family RNA polymerase sigma factor [Blastocatellia bacterium]